MTVRLDDQGTCDAVITAVHCGMGIDELASLLQRTHSYPAQRPAQAIAETLEWRRAVLDCLRAHRPCFLCSEFVRLGEPKPCPISWGGGTHRCRLNERHLGDCIPVPKEQAP